MSKRWETPSKPTTTLLQSDEGGLAAAYACGDGKGAVVAVTDNEDSSWLLRKIHRTVYKELDASYGFYEAMFFPMKKPIEKFYASIAEGCPRLEKLDRNFFSKLAMDERRRIGTARLYLIAISALFLITAIADSSLGAIIIFFGFWVELIVLSIMNRRDREFLAARCLLLTVRVLERYQENWNSAEFRGRIAAQLEVAAALIETIPLTARHISANLRRDLLLSGRRKAEAVRRLEYSVMAPASTTYEELIEVLTDDFVKLITGRWHSLPEADYEKKPSRSKAALRIGGGVLVMAAAVAVTAIFYSRLGPEAPAVIIGVAGVVALASLKSAGLSTESIGRYVEVSQKLGPGSIGLSEHSRRGSD